MSKSLTKLWFLRVVQYQGKGINVGNDPQPGTKA